MSRGIQVYREQPDLRLELRVKNNVLWHAIYDTHRSLGAFCHKFRRYNISAGTVGALLRFKLSPWTKKGEYRPVVQGLESALGIAADELFPRDLYERVTNPTGVIEVSSFTALPGTIQKELRYLPAPAEVSDEATLELEREREERIEAVLKTLTPREGEVIRRRFGFLTGTTQTLKEIGGILGIGDERVRQIQEKALRKLRQPFRAKKLVPLLDEAARTALGLE